MNNIIKIGAALAVLFAGIYGYYTLEVSPLVKFAVLLVSILVATGVAAISDSGRALIEFSKGSQIELRKMVWPTRQETVQTTMIVMVMVVIVALFLWVIDIAVFEVIYDLLLGVDS